MEVTFKITKAVVLVTNFMDEICLSLDTKTPFPELGYEATACIKARHGYGETWCKEVLKITPEVKNIEKSYRK